MLTRQELTNTWSKRFAGMDHGYWITLNSKIRVQDRYDRHIPNKFIEFGGMVEQFIDLINERCYGRRYIRHEPNARLTSLVSYEVGNEDGLVHCHILAAHDGSTNRTVEDLKRVSIWKWSGLCNTEGSTQFVDVDAIGNIHDRIWYMTKQSENHQRLFGEFNLSLH